MNKYQILLTALTLALVYGCAALGLGTPSVATDQCFAYCIDVPVAGKIVAWCYDTKVEQQTALATLNAAKVPARLRK
jgi:hypothetical protein